MIKCDRETFILLSEGVLMERTADRKVRIGDTAEAHAAMDAHERGEPVWLTPANTIIQDGVERLPKKGELK